MSSMYALYASTYNLTCLTIERYRAIINPLHYNNEVVLRRLPYIFVSIWLLTCLGTVYIPIATVMKDGVCVMAAKMRGNWLWDFYPVYSLVIALLIPGLIMVVCYVRMFLVLRRSLRNIRAAGNGCHDVQNIDKLRLAQRNIFETCFVIMLFYLVCWITKDSALLLYASNVYSDIGNVHYTIGRLMIVVNSCLNPYIYGIRYNDFKQQLKHLCRSVFKSSPAKPRKVELYRVKTITI